MAHNHFIHRLATIGRGPCLLAILGLVLGLFAPTAAAQSCGPSLTPAQVTIQAGSPPTYYVFALEGLPHRRIGAELYQHRVASEFRKRK